MLWQYSTGFSHYFLPSPALNPGTALRPVRNATASQAQSRKTALPFGINPAWEVLRQSLQYQNSRTESLSLPLTILPEGHCTAPHFPTADLLPSELEFCEPRQSLLWKKAPCPFLRILYRPPYKSGHSCFVPLLHSIADRKPGHLHE